jgi:ribosomal protein S18 acetylase RimI-like enzyme
MQTKRKATRRPVKKQPLTKTKRLGIKLENATADDASEIAALRNASADHLTAKHGNGPWSGHISDKGVLFNMRNGKVFVVRRKGQITVTLSLSTKKPWAIDKKYFRPSEKPLYLTAMAVTPNHQREGLGSRCLQAALKFCKQQLADAVRLDAYDSAGGAGGFYQRCGFTEVGKASYRNVPLIYYEMLL